MIWSAYDHAESYINLPVGGKYAPCWLSEMDDDQIKVLKMDPKTNFDTIYDIITKPDNKFCEVFAGNKHEATPASYAIHYCAHSWKPALLQRLAAKLKRRAAKIGKIVNKG